MPDSGIPEDIRQFIFTYVDSVAQLEALFFLRLNQSRAFTPEELSAQMRSSLGSAQATLVHLETSGLVTREVGAYRYALAGTELDGIVGSLAQEFRLRPHKIFEQIFSPMKRARQFADAFLMGGGNKPKKEEDENG